MRAEVARAREEEAEMARKHKRLDMELELAREKALAELRADEATRTAAAYGSVVDKVRIPIPITQTSIP